MTKNKNENKNDICSGCMGPLRGAKIKRNQKDVRECRDCPVFNTK